MQIMKGVDLTMVESEHGGRGPQEFTQQAAYGARRPAKFVLPGQFAADCGPDNPTSACGNFNCAVFWSSTLSVAIAN